ncbi:histidine kinase [Nonlabens ponticola]|uniref:Histidine kinase n=2 Tax=Nonlabens ponticola TaxID=2496866 RepID=A0A3S9N0Z7_9FLAO|nr:histidine kinase [Nonlabens ponticola]
MLAESFAINFLFAFTLTLVNETYFSYLTTIFPWTTAAVKRLLVGILGSCVLTMIALFLVRVFVAIVIYGRTLDNFIESERMQFYIIGVIFTLVISVIFHAIYFYKELQQAKIQEQKVIAGSATAQFDALKNQLDPHFLFNSLNVLVSLIEENQDAAVKFTTSLSKVYRYVLEQRGKQLVSVQEELEFARLYVQLLKMRFEDSLIVDIADSSVLPDQYIVPLSLQLLIENAVKHNVVSSSQPLHLSIHPAGDKLVVSNTLSPKKVLSTTTGVGLQNIASRYGLISTQQMSVLKSETHFNVQLPMLPLNPELPKTKAMEIQLEDQKLVNAREKVKNMKEFYDELVRFIFIIAFLGLLNYFTSDFPWVIFPAIGMSIGLFFKYMKNFDRHILLGKNWEEQKINKYMNDSNF